MQDKTLLLSKIELCLEKVVYNYIYFVQFKTEDGYYCL